MLKKFNMSECKIAKTPSDTNEKLTSNIMKECDGITGQVPYQEAVGSLLYMAQCTRSDIQFAVTKILLTY